MARVRTNGDFSWAASMDNRRHLWTDRRCARHASNHNRQLPSFSHLYDMASDARCDGRRRCGNDPNLRGSPRNHDRRSAKTPLEHSDFRRGYNYSTLLGGPLGEEPGWRGYALPRLESAFGPVRGTLLLGLLWTGWHLPLFFYPSWTSEPLWIYVVLVMGQSFILTYAANLAGFGVVTPIAMHATFNTVSRFLNGLFASTQPQAWIPFGWVMALCGVATAAVLILATRGQLAYGKNSSLIGRVDTPSTR
jgi:hypothetical protein